MFKGRQDMIVYYHIPEDKARRHIFRDETSEYGNFLINIGNGPKNVITAYLCPADDIRDITGRAIPACYRFSHRKDIYNGGRLSETENTQALKASLTKAAEYRLGSYRKPLLLSPRYLPKE